MVQSKECPAPTTPFDQVLGALAAPIMGDPIWRNRLSVMSSLAIGDVRVRELSVGIPEGAPRAFINALEGRGADILATTVYALAREEDRLGLAREAGAREKELLLLSALEKQLARVRSDHAVAQYAYGFEGREMTRDEHEQWDMKITALATMRLQLIPMPQKLTPPEIG